MNKIICLIFILFSLSFAIFGQDLMVDGMTEYKTATIRPEIQTAFDTLVFPRAKKYFKDSAECSEELAINDGAAISVIDNYYEKAFLYTYCGDDASNSYQGIAIIENGKIKKHYVFNTFVLHYSNILYRNGLLVLLGYGTKRQSNWTIATTLELADNSQNSFMVYENMCNENGGNCKEKAQKIFYEAGDGYFFWTEGYEFKNKQWVKTKARKDVTNVEPDAGLKEVMKDLKEIK